MKQIYCHNVHAVLTVDYKHYKQDGSWQKASLHLNFQDMIVLETR